MRRLHRLTHDGKQLAVARFDGAALLLDPASGKTTAQPLPVKPVAPKAEKASPAGVPRGRTTTVTVTGKDLDHARSVTASVPGVTARLGTPSPERVEMELTVPADAAVISMWHDVYLDFAYPPIARYRTDGRRMGRKAADFLLHQLRHGTGKVRKAPFMPEFVE